MEPKSLPNRSCEAKRAKEERQSAQDDPQSAPEATFTTHPVHFEVPGRILGSPRGEGPLAGDVDCGAGKSSNSSKMEGFTSAGALFSESRLPDPGDKYK